tara:strand:+ start:98626 stop:99831 length:1206 start_codon:yes stop_codon:yes gene_type:complete
MTVSLSIEQARKLVLQAQRILSGKQSGTAISATLSAIEHLGYIQIDTISVVQRAHHHTLWNRNPRYKLSQLDQLVADKQVFEYWSHAAAYLPMKDFRFTLPRKKAITNGSQDHWGPRDDRLMKSILKRVETEGPLMARDFDHSGKKTGDWGLKPAKRALEYLFMQGDLMAPYRDNFHKVYDLTERALPESTDTSLPSPEEYARFLITRYLRANGLGQAVEMAYLLKDTRAQVSSALHEMVSSGELLEVHTAGETYFALPSSLELLDKSLARSRVKILSPFDNLLIQRKRMKQLFGFDYLVECYVPEPKRRYGYFALPVLWNGRLVARMDCKADRKNSILHINQVFLEPMAANKTDAFCLALAKELESFRGFNQCKTVKLHRTSPASYKSVLTAAINDRAAG